MKKIIAVVLTFSISHLICYSQMQKTAPLTLVGNVTDSSAELLIQPDSSVNFVSVKLRKKGSNGKYRRLNLSTFSNSKFKSGKINVTGLSPATTYNYNLIVAGKIMVSSRFKTKSRVGATHAPADFAFITGSCAYLEKGRKNKSGEAFEPEDSIFSAMSQEKAAFMLWLGDNWYYRGDEYNSEIGLPYRPHRDRSNRLMREFLKSMPQYAIWDDHDYGYNNADKNFKFKQASRKTFMENWSNPSFGEKDEGVYTKFSYEDVDLFLLDDRWFRTNDTVPSVVDGKLNSEKRMLGEKQMDWFKREMMRSKANPNIHFRIIANGSEILNPYSPLDCFRHFTVEYNEMMQFLTDEKIDGLLFLTGDRHFSEINKAERKIGYTFFDITSSALTSDPVSYTAPEKNNPDRILAVTGKNNYTKFSFSGAGDARKVVVEFFGVHGERLAQLSVNLSQLKM